VPTIADKVSIAIGASNDNIVAGSPFEFLPYAAMLEFGLSGQRSLILATITTGSDVVAEEHEIPGTNRVPIYPDDFYTSDVAARGQRLRIAARNTNAAAGPDFVFSSVRINPLGMRR